MPFPAHARRLPLQPLRQQGLRAADELSGLRTHPDSKYASRAQLSPSLPPAQLERSFLGTRPLTAGPESLLRMPYPLPSCTAAEVSS